MNPEKNNPCIHPDGDPDRHQNLTVCPLAHCQPSLKITCKAVWKFLRKVANRQTAMKHILLDGGNIKQQLLDLFLVHPRTL